MHIICVISAGSFLCALHQRHTHTHMHTSDLPLIIYLYRLRSQTSPPTFTDSNFDQQPPHYSTPNIGRALWSKADWPEGKGQLLAMLIFLQLGSMLETPFWIQLAEVEFHPITIKLITTGVPHSAKPGCKSLGGRVSNRPK